jgi:hypothetical protein
MGKSFMPMSKKPAAVPVEAPVAAAAPAAAKSSKGGWTPKDPVARMLVSDLEKNVLWSALLYPSGKEGMAGKLVDKESGSVTRIRLSFEDSKRDKTRKYFIELRNSSPEDEAAMKANAAANDGKAFADRIKPPTLSSEFEFFCDVTKTIDESKPYLFKGDGSVEDADGNKVEFKVTLFKFDKEKHEAFRAEMIASGKWKDNK